MKSGITQCSGHCHKVKDKVNFWCRFLVRLQGRGLMYIFVGCVQFCQRFWLAYISGIVMIIAGVMCVCVARHAVKKVKAYEAR